MPNFHLKMKVLSLLGGLWAKNYANNAAFQTAVEANLDLLAQAQIDTQEAIDCVDRHTVPIFHTELWLPIRIKEDVPTQIDGLRELPLLFNRLTSPSLVWHSGIDFEVTADGSIIFRENITKQSLVPTIGEKGEREAVLWGYGAKFERNYLADHFGSLVDREKPSSQAYKDLLNAIFDQLAFGTTISTLESVLNALLGVPLAQQDGEVVQGRYFDARGPFVATNVQIYRIPDNASDRVIRGQQLCRGEPVYKAVKLQVDTTTYPQTVVVSAPKEHFDAHVLRQLLPTEFQLRFA